MYSSKSDSINQDLGYSKSYQDDFDNMNNYSLEESKKEASVTPKKVQFDETDVRKELKQQKPSQRDAIVRITELLQALEDEIDHHYNTGQSSKRDKALVEYCQTANEAAQNLNLQDENDQQAAMLMLEHCIKVITKNSNKLNPFSELYYETFNNMARCCNIQGDIKQSLLFLVKAMGHVKALSKEQEPGSVTIIPELSLNICNANIYLKNYHEALQYADQAIVSSKQCISSLERKLEQLAGTSNSSNPERERLSQLYLSQINLHIQGFQAKGQAYEKIKAFSEAIREFNKAKQVVEQNFGTQHKMFMELVNQVSAANVNLKTQNYSGKSEVVAPPSKSAAANQGRGRAGKGLKSKKQKKQTSENENVQSNGQSIDIRSDKKDYSDLERVSKMSKKSIQTEVAGGRLKGSLIFDGDDTGSNKQRVHHAVTAKKRRRLGLKQDYEQVVADHILQSKAPQGPARPLSAHSASLTLIQPPWNAGSPSKISKAACYFNKNTRYNLTNEKDLWKVDHQVHPQMLGDIGFATLNPERPKRLYYQDTRLPRKRPHSSSVRNVRHDSHLYSELHKMRQYIKHREMVEIEERIKIVQQQQVDQQKNVLSALDQQKALMLESQFKVRERARQEREALLGQKFPCCDRNHNHQHSQAHNSYDVQNNFGYQGMQQQQQQQQQAPPIHPQYGPAVFDYNYGSWTYPYAQWYGLQNDQQQQPEHEQQYVQHDRFTSLPSKHEISIQKDFDFDPKPKPEVNMIATQTTKEVKAVTQDFAIQTQSMKVAEIATSPIKKQSVKFKQDKKESQPKSKYTQVQAIQMLARLVRQVVRRKREAAYRYRDIDGLLLTQKWKYNKQSGKSEIMAMYAVPGPDRKCLCLRFTIFDYATKQFIFVGVFDNVNNVHDFDVQILQDVSKESLDLVAFERPPFKMHLMCLQSIINTYMLTSKSTIQDKAPDAPQKQIQPQQTSQSPPKQVIKQQQKSPQKDPIIAMKPITNTKPQVTKKPAAGKSLKKPKVAKQSSKSNSEKLIFIQSRIRGFLARIAYKRIMQSKIKNKERLDSSNSLNTDQPQISSSKVLYHMNKKVECNQGCKDKNGDCCRRFFSISLVKHIHDNGHRYDLKVRELGNKNAVDKFWPIPTGLRLPQPEDDPSNNPLLGHYLPLATIIEFKRSKENEADGQCKCSVDSVKLLRMKIQHQTVPIKEIPQEKPEPVSFQMGCVLQFEFELKEYPHYLCRVYRRIRWEDETTKERKVKDWKIKVIQQDEPQSWDYLVVRRLPCPLSSLEDHLNINLGIQLNKRIIPAAILHIFWVIGDITVFSQAYFDLTSSRFDVRYRSCHYMSQNLETQRRHVSLKNIEAISKFHEDKTKNAIDRDYWDPLYCIYVQDLVPKSLTCKPWIYSTPEYLKRKERVKQQKEKERNDKLAKNKSLLVNNDNLVNSKEAVSETSSEDEEDDTKYKDCQCFWDIDQLEKMQLDEITIKRQYIKLSCQSTTNTQDQDHFRVENNIARWAHPDVEFQYLMECLAIKQINDPISGETTLDLVGLNIRADESRFESDSSWNLFLKSSKSTETFMAADQQRWRNQHFNVTVFNLKSEGAGIVIEAINIDRPHQRAYILQYDGFKGMRGQVLKYFIDEKLKISGSKEINSNSQTGFGRHVIDHIAFSCDPEQFKIKLKSTKQYQNMEFENSDSEHAKEEAPKGQQYQAVVDVHEQTQHKQSKTSIVEDQKKKTSKAHKTDWTNEDQRRAAIVVQKWRRMIVQRRCYNLKQIKSQIQVKFNLKLKISQMKMADLFIIVKKYENNKKPVHYKFVIINQSKQKKRYDDTLQIQAQRLPGGLSNKEKDTSKFMNIFRDKLKIIWDTTNGGMKMKDGFIDDTVREVKKVETIVEVKVHEDKYKEVRPPKSTDSDDDSDESAVSATEQEMLLIKQDINDIKAVLKKIKKKIEQLGIGYEGWFLHFDRDNSDAIELHEHHALQAV